MDGTVLRVSVFVALAVLAPAAGFSGRLGRGKSDAMAGAFGVSGVSDSLDTPPIGAIGTEGAAAGRAAGMDGSGVLDTRRPCGISGKIQ